MPIFSKARDNVREANREVVGQTLTLFNQALALVAALAWNEAVKAVIDRYFPAQSGLYSKFAYALILTLLVVVISRYLNRIKLRFQPPEKA
jgi:uncharacterized membrane protein YidH (DUF202 family)